MALVSPSLSPANGLSYGATPPAFSRSSSDPPPAQIRALPTIPTGAARRQGSQQSLGGSGGTSPAPQQPRSLPPTAAGRSPSAPPFVELASSRSVSPLPPASTSRSITPSRSTSTPSPSPYQHHQHTLSASSSASSSAGSLPRLPPVHLAQGPNSAPPVPNGLVGVQQYPQHHQQHHQHPSFVGHHQPFPSFGGGVAAAPHAFPHPQYPFIPSPHPHPGGPGAALGYQPGPYSPGFNAPQGGPAAGSSAASAESQHQARLVQQAHLQQQQWQMEMMRNQQQQGQAFDWQQQQQGELRVRFRFRAVCVSSGFGIAAIWRRSSVFASCGKVGGGYGGLRGQTLEDEGQNTLTPFPSFRRPSSPTRNFWSRPSFSLAYLLHLGASVPSIALAYPPHQVPA